MNARSIHKTYEYLPIYTVLSVIDLQCTTMRDLDTMLAIKLHSKLPTRGIYTTYGYLPIYTVLSVIDLYCTPTTHLDTMFAIN